MPSPVFGKIFPPHVPRPTVVGFLSAPFHRPCRVSDKDSAPRDGTASEADGGGQGGQKGWFPRMALCPYCGFVHGAEVSLMEWSGHGDPSFRVPGKRSNPRAEISSLLGNLSKMCSPCVFKVMCRKPDGKQNFGGRFLSRSWPRPPDP